MRVLIPLSALYALLIAGCGGSPAPAEEPAPDAVEPSTADEPPAPPPRWPRPIPPERYRVEEVESPAVVRGTVLAATEGRGVHFAVQDSELCTEELLPEVFAPGPLPNVVLRLEGVAAGVPLPVRDVQVEVGGCDLSPRVQLAPLGSDVAFTATDGGEHSPHMILWDGYRDLGAVGAAEGGGLDSRRLRIPGLVHLRCDSHPAARAWIWVQDHPYHALTGADGTYRMTDVPPGRYVLHAWHEGFEAQSLEVNVPPSGELLLDLVLTGA